jgi:hypothetical protein
MEMLCRFGEIMALRVLISWTSCPLRARSDRKRGIHGHSRIGATLLDLLPG